MMERSRSASIALLVVLAASLAAAPAHADVEFRVILVETRDPATLTALRSVSAWRQKAESGLLAELEGGVTRGERTTENALRALPGMQRALVWKASKKRYDALRPLSPEMVRSVRVAEGKSRTDRFEHACATTEIGFAAVRVHGATPAGDPATVRADVRIHIPDGGHFAQAGQSYPLGTPIHLSTAGGGPGSTPASVLFLEALIANPGS